MNWEIKWTKKKALWKFGFCCCFSHEYKQKHDVRQYSSEARQQCLFFIFVLIYYFTLSLSLIIIYTDVNACDLKT